MDLPFPAIIGMLLFISLYFVCPVQDVKCFETLGPLCCPVGGENDPRETALLFAAGDGLRFAWVCA
jgi:hypothetical protein